MHAVKRRAGRRRRRMFGKRRARREAAHTEAAHAAAYHATMATGDAMFAAQRAFEASDSDLARAYNAYHEDSTPETRAAYEAAIAADPDNAAFAAYNAAMDANFATYSLADAQRKDPDKLPSLMERLVEIEADHAKYGG